MRCHARFKNRNNKPVSGLLTIDANPKGMNIWTSAFRRGCGPSLRCCGACESAVARVGLEHSIGRVYAIPRPSGLATALAEDNYQRYSESSNTGLSTLNAGKPFMTKMMM